MRNIKLYHYGKVKNSALAELRDYYQKLLSQQFKLEVISLKDPGERKVNIKDLPAKAGYTVVLSEKGEELDSLEFSSKLYDLFDEHGQVSFVIGNAFGFETEVLEEADLVLSLSMLTLPHEFALVLTLEQLYRASDIFNKGKYHK